MNSARLCFEAVNRAHTTGMYKQKSKIEEYFCERFGTPGKGFATLGRGDVDKGTALDEVVEAFSKVFSVLVLIEVAEGEEDV